MATLKRKNSFRITKKTSCLLDEFIMDRQMRNVERKKRYRVTFLVPQGRVIC